MDMEVRDLDLYTVMGKTTDPYYNLALEEYLLYHIPADAMVLYLWQNDHTVVIGRNQNPWAECRTSLLQEENGRIARRLSGGGAVYHDLGNLNFTFLCKEEHYDVKKQLSVIQKAAAYAGIQAEFSGRNDLLTGGKKFSGNAFYHSKGNAYHHGTLLVCSNLQRLQRYLSPPKAKLESKGISSVRSRVINLSQLSPALTCPQMQAYMIQAFGDVYSGIPRDFSNIQQEEVRQLQTRYASHHWLFGKPMPFTCRLEGNFPWGNLEILLSVHSGIIQDIQIFTDAMDHTVADRLANTLKGCTFQATHMIQAISGIPYEEDLAGFIQSQEL